MIVYNCPMMPFEFFKTLEVPYRRIKESGCEFDRLSPNLCSFCKRSISLIDKDDVLVWVDSCDSSRRAADFLKKTNKVFELHIPVVSDEGAVLKLADELRALWQFLNSIYGERSYEKLTQTHREIQRDLQLLGKFMDEDLKEAVQVYERITNEKWVASIQGSNTKVLVIGAPVDEKICKIIEKNNGFVLNATCSGPFALLSEIVDTGDPFKNIAHRILHRDLMCMRAANQRRLSTLIETLKPDLIVLHTVKFCDFYSFDERELKQLGVPFVAIENDLTSSSNAQIETRIQALMELAKDHKSNNNGEYELFAGIDSGSTTTKIAVIDQKAVLLYQKVTKTGAYPALTAKRLYEEMLKDSKIPAEKVYLVATGYGRASLNFANEQVTEITCHAKGVQYFFPSVRTIIDIGGQDSKVIKVDNGQVVEFVMNDKCAAGTGRFLEVMANVLDVPLQKIGRLSLNHRNEIDISSVCTVFAESEVVSLRAMGHTREDILYAIHRAIARRIGSMYDRIKGAPPVILTGGVALNEGLKAALEALLKVPTEVPTQPVITGALGAAVIGLLKNRR
ncbi:acyl-CoA dehydratase activase [Pseudothermotoga sp. U03pept]|uniref:acyl-CoA dehydratase activase n=1 Tax=Pseudothermotoga sp. U03pept TaxID=3447012 RepID=UPI003EFD870A